MSESPHEQNVVITTGTIDNMRTLIPKSSIHQKCKQNTAHSHEGKHDGNTTAASWTSPHPRKHLYFCCCKLVSSNLDVHTYIPVLKDHQGLDVLPVRRSISAKVQNLVAVVHHELIGLFRRIFHELSATGRQERKVLRCYMATCVGDGGW